MFKLLLPLALAFISGISMAVQGSLNSVLGKIAGLFQATLVVHVIASLAVAVILLLQPVLQPAAKGSLAHLPRAPWYVYLGGLLAVLITYAVVTAIPRVGVAPATTAIIVGQVGAAALIDHFGLFGLQKIPFNLLKLAGVALLAAGAWLLLNQTRA